jgi:hypothetical protein
MPQDNAGLASSCSKGDCIGKLRKDCPTSFCKKHCIEQGGCVVHEKLVIVEEEEHTPYLRVAFERICEKTQEPIFFVKLKNSPPLWLNRDLMREDKHLSGMLDEWQSRREVIMKDWHVHGSACLPKSGCLSCLFDNDDTDTQNPAKKKPRWEDDLTTHQSEANKPNKNLRTCTRFECGGSIPAGAKFCQECGTKATSEGRFDYSTYTTAQVRVMKQVSVATLRKLDAANFAPLLDFLRKPVLARIDESNKTLVINEDGEFGTRRANSKVRTLYQFLNCMNNYIYLDKIFHPALAQDRDEFMSDLLMVLDDGVNWNTIYEFFERVRMRYNGSVFLWMEKIDLWSLRSYPQRQDGGRGGGNSFGGGHNFGGRNQKHGRNEGGGNKRKFGKEGNHDSGLCGLCRSKELCYTFQLGYCKKQGPHDHTDRKGRLLTGLKHKCAKCDGDHPGKQCG